jgi:hypothetical protein
VLHWPLESQVRLLLAASTYAGNRKSGGCRVLYDPSRSQRGVLVGAARLPRQPSPFDVTPELLAKLTYQQPLYRRERLLGRWNPDGAGYGWALNGQT